MIAAYYKPVRMARTEQYLCNICDSSAVWKTLSYTKIHFQWTVILICLFIAHAECLRFTGGAGDYCKKTPAPALI